MTRDEIRLLEELNFNAWPTLRTAYVDGWLLRSGGESRRANSVNPLAPGVLSLREKIEAAKAIYARWGRPAVFRFTPLADDGLDDELAERGYVVDGASFVQVADVSPRVATSDIRLFERADSEWLDGVRAIRGLGGELAEAFDAQHRAVGVETRWALIRDGSQPVAVGVAAIERGWVGLHGIYVAKEARRRGLARQMSEALLGRAHTLGARRAWLQVDQANAAALRLYAGLGFRTAYSYWYRVRPQ